MGKLWNLNQIRVGKVGMNKKNFRFALLLFAIILHQIVAAQPLLNSSNMFIGKIESDGTVHDKMNMMIGKFGSDGIIKNRNYMTVGKIERDGIIRDHSYMMIGKVERNGEVKDRNYMRIGRVRPDGTVANSNNMTIGYAKGIPVTYAAVFFFFKLFE